MSDAMRSSDESRSSLLPSIEQNRASTSSQQDGSSSFLPSTSTTTSYISSSNIPIEKMKGPSRDVLLNEPSIISLPQEETIAQERSSTATSTRPTSSLMGKDHESSQVMPRQEDYSLRRHSLTFAKPSRKRGISFLGEKRNQDYIAAPAKRPSLKRVSTVNAMRRSITNNSCFVLGGKYGARPSYQQQEVCPFLHQDQKSPKNPGNDSSTSVLINSVGSSMSRKSSNTSCVSIISTSQRKRKSLSSRANASFNSSNGSLNTGGSILRETSFGSKNGSDNNVAFSKKAEATENEEWLQHESLKFNQYVDNQISTIEDAKLLVKKTREVSMLSNRFMLAPTGNECYEIVSRLLYSLFGVDRCSYTLMMDEENFLLQECSFVALGPSASDFIFSDGEEDAIVHPLKDCATEHCAESLDAYYCQDLATANLYPEYKTFRRVGSKSFLSVPILIGARKFAGALHIASEQANAFNEMDIMLIKDIGYRIGGHLYSKRLQEEQIESYNASRKLLQSMIPGPVLEKIEDHWKTSVEQNDDLLSCTESCNLDCSTHETHIKDNAKLSPRTAFNNIRRDSFTASKMEVTQRRLENIGILKRESCMRLGMRHMTPTSSITSESGISDSKPVLFAETQSNVSMIFCDIVGFSRIAHGLQPIEVMQMLNDLYHIFDTLCEKHGVRKLETIGDTYIVSGGLLEEGNDKDAGKGAAVRCLAMAQDMVREAYNVYAPTETRERLQIRVGIHVGNLSYGILGQNVPKFSVYGDAVNIAARMEQTAPVGKVHVSKAFHDLVNDHHMVWDEKRNTDVKNVGVMETWIMDPMRIPVNIIMA
ncbi:hypothetical protein CTEN210_18163 [Chaetoceros tenuissimus]|uniref:Guanylate cyclase domain-containing protein n=1 Tax=Chaetoceros tenuissimus TaxID=426638 RepID=A0AAD3DCY8_9STRA|nr:hypothetical protein CTEN210_18163 [Chaetoceros tenuissimus]